MRLLTSTLIAFCVLAFGPPAAAQNCGTIYEEILTLKPPVFGVPSVWDVIYGETGMEKFSDLLFLEEDVIIAAGEYTKDETDNIYHPMLVNLDYRGKVRWETRQDSKEHTTIEGLIQTKYGYTVFGDIIDKKKGYGVYIAHYNKQGKYKSRKTIFEKDADLDAVAIQMAHDKSGFILMAQYTHVDDQEDQFGLLFKVDRSDNVLWRRAYKLGAKTHFHNLIKFPNKSYMATGAIEQEDGRMAGWLIRLSESGAILWQRPYPRGIDSALRAAVERPDGTIITGGGIKPSDGGPLSGWVMAVDGAGQPLWQKYYRGDYFYAVHDIAHADDGRISVLMKGDPVEISEKSYVGLMTLSPRGYLMNYEPYVNGYNAHSYKLHKGPNQERVIVGHSQTTFPDTMSHDNIDPHTFDGWIVGAVALEKYKDPCRIHFPSR